VSFDYGLDWSKGKVYGKDLDRSIVESKFAAYDKAVADETIFSTQSQLLYDDTIFAYAFLNWNGRPIKLRYYQDAIMSDSHRRIDVEAANQQGKTFALCTKAAVNFLRDHSKNYTIALVSKSMAQNSSNMRMVRQMLKTADIEYTPGSSDSMTTMTRNIYDDNGNVKYTNTLVCLVASTSSLGFPMDLCLLDEFEFWQNPEGLEYMYDQVFNPRTFDTKGQIIMYSNPNGKNFVSEDLHQRKLVNGEYLFHTYNINYLDNPDNTKAEWDEAQAHVHPIIFASTMAALRTESEGSALTGKDIDDAITDELLKQQDKYFGKGKSCVFFLDLGFTKDQCVLVGITTSTDDDGKLVLREFYQQYYPIGYPIEAVFGKIDGDEPTIPSILDEYKLDGYRPMFGMDITGKEGNEVHARDVGIDVTPVKMTGPWKATWYGQFISLVKQRRFKTVNISNYRDGKNKDWFSQAHTLMISTKMPDGRTRPYPIYHHTKETDLDDAIDATVGAISLIDEELGGQVSSEFIEYDTITKETGSGNSIGGSPVHEMTEADEIEVEEAMALNNSYRDWLW